MNLDMHTIVVMLLLSAVLMAVVLAVGIRTAGRNGFAKWNIGLGCYALGWVLLAARGKLPAVIGVALGDALLLAGLCGQLAGIIEFGGKTAPRLLIGAPAVLMFALMIPLLDDYPTLAAVASAAYAIVLAAIAVAAARLESHAGPARWMLAMAYGGGAIIVPLRALDIWLHPYLKLNLIADGFLHAAPFLAMFAGTVVGSVAFLLMHHERAEADLYRLATFDPLTGLFNRGAFMQLAERELARARRITAPWAVLMMDLDWFKRVNDEYGHQAGDRVLADFGAIARVSVRTMDLLGRYGGEEFCAILPGATALVATEIAGRIRQAVAQRPLGGLPRAITVSIGVVAYGAGAAGPLDAAIARADEALYRAKSEGRNRVVALDPAQPTEPPAAIT